MTRFQVNYATKAAKKGSLVVAVKSEYGVCLATHIRKSIDDEKIFRLDNNIAVSFSGLQADSRILIDKSREQFQSLKLQFNESIFVKKLVQKVSELYQKPTQYENQRVWGCALLFIGVDSTGPHIYVVPPNGDFKSFNAYALGSENEKAIEYLNYYYEDDLSFNSMINLTLKSLDASVYEIITKENINLVYIKSEDKIFHICTKDEIDKYIKDMK